MPDSIPPLRSRGSFYRMPGAAKRFFDAATNTEISYRKYRELTTPRPTPAQDKLIAQYIAKQRSIGNKSISRRSRNEIYNSRAFRKVLIGLESKDLGPTGPKAKALVELGLRKEDWSHDVGMSKQFLEGLL